MSTEDTTEYSGHAEPKDVRAELHTIDWDPTRLENKDIRHWLEKRARPIVENVLIPAGSPVWEQQQIEPLLAGHYILASGNDELRQVTSDSTPDGASDSYSGDLNAMGLRSTSLGQQAIELDSTGELAEMAASVENADEADERLPENQFRVV